MTPLPVKLTNAERDRIEADALEAMTVLYSDQMGRVMSALSELDPNTVTAGQIAAIFEDEPGLTAEDYIAFFGPVAEGLALAGLLDLGSVGVAGLNGAGTALGSGVESLLQRYIRLTGELFGEEISANSRNLTFEVIQAWRVDEGATVADLRDRLTRVWEGPRPQYAATTETTRIVAESRGIAWREVDVWGFRIVTRYPGPPRTRQTHADVAANGPYPMSLWDQDHIPPLFGDINCFCDVLPVVDNPNE